MLKATSKRFIEENYRIEEEALNAALLTTGNGYIGVRGSYEEYGSIRIQGAYIRGVIDEIIEVIEPFADNEYMKKYYIDEDKLKHFEYQDSVVNNADFLLMRVSVDGETFYPWEGKLHSWTRYLDMTNASLVVEDIQLMTGRKITFIEPTIYNFLSAPHQPKSNPPLQNIGLSAKAYSRAIGFLAEQ